MTATAKSPSSSRLPLTPWRGVTATIVVLFFRYLLPAIVSGSAHR